MPARTSSKASKALIGSLVDEMQSENFVARVTRGAQKRQEARTDEDIDAILSVTQELPLMKHCGPEVQRDLCYAIRLGSYEDGDVISSPADLKGEGALFLVLSGSLQVKAPDNVPFGSMLWRGQVEGRGGHGNSHGQQRLSRTDMPTPLAGSPPPRSSFQITEVTQQEMRSVFSSLDLDNNGTLSIDELQIALESFGMPTGYEEVKEMVLKVDADSDGIIDFDEFQAVIKNIFTRHKQKNEEMLGTGKWEGDESGGFIRTFVVGDSFGENSIMYNMPLAAEMVAIGKTEVLRLESKDYIAVLDGGGIDGNLDAKLEALSSNVMLEKYARKTDRKALAMAMKTESVRVQSTLYKQGAPAETLYIIVSGQANVVSALEVNRDVQDKSPSPLRGRGSPMRGRSGPGRSGSIKPPKLREIAIVGAGDICGEAVLLDQPAHSTGVVASSNLEVLSIKKKDALRILADRDLKELQEYVRERDVAREARMQTSQENMKTATSKMMLTHQKASNEEALAGDLANTYGNPSRFLPGEAEGALSRSFSGIANMESAGSASTLAPNPKASAWWDPSIIDSSSQSDPPQAVTSGQSAGLPEGSEELIKSMRNLNPAGLRSLKGVQYNAEEVSRVLQLGAVDQEIEQPPRSVSSREQSLSTMPSKFPNSERSSPSPPRIWFQSSGSPLTTTRDSAPLKQRNSSEAERQKPLEHRASQSISMGQDSDWWVQASIRRNMNLGSSMFAEGKGDEQDPFVRFTASRHEKVAAAAAAAEAKRQVPDAVPPESLPPELLVVESKGGGVPLPVNKLKPHVLLKSKVNGDKIYTPSAMRAAPLAVPPLVHSPFHPYPRVSPGASPDASRASSPRPLSPPRFSPVPAERYTSPQHSRAGDASPARSISPEGMAVNITRSHETQKSRQGSPYFSPKSSRCPSPGRLLADEERKALASREKHDYLQGLSKMLNSLPREMGATFPVYHVTEKEPRLPYGYNYIRKQKNKAKALAKRGFSPPAGVTRRHGQLDGLQHGQQDVAALEQRALMLELLMDRNESDRVRYFKLQKDVSGLKAQIMNAKVHNQATSTARPAAGKWTTAGARRLAMKKKI